MPSFAQNRFARAGAAAGTPARRPQSRFAGVNSADAYGSRDPLLAPGDYVLEVLGTIESKVVGKKPWFKISVKVIESGNVESPVDSQSTIMWCTNQESEGASFPKMKLWAMACTCCDTDVQYKELEEKDGGYEGAFLDDAMLGGQTFVGCRFAARVTHGRPDGQGGYYNEYQFATADGQ